MYRYRYNSQYIVMILLNIGVYLLSVLVSVWYEFQNRYRYRFDINSGREYLYRLNPRQHKDTKGMYRVTPHLKSDGSVHPFSFRFLKTMVYGKQLPYNGCTLIMVLCWRDLIPLALTITWDIYICNLSEAKYSLMNYIVDIPLSYSNKYNYQK
jgi:hypothetical protein